MILSLLTDETSSSDPTSKIISYVLIGVLLVLVIGSMFLMQRRRKKQEKETQDQMDAIGPGNKVTTIGGVVGIVVAVDPIDQTFILETGDEEHGKCYVKFLKQAIYQSDAIVEKNKKDDKEAAKEEAEEKAETSVPEASAEEANVEAETEEKKD